MSNNHFYVRVDVSYKEMVENVIIEGGVVLAGPVAVWGEGHFQQFGLHVAFVDHHVHSVHGSTVHVMHFRVLLLHRHKQLIDHCLHFRIHFVPVPLVLLLKFVDELVEVYLSQISAVVHHCKVGLVFKYLSTIGVVIVVRSPDPEHLV